MLYTPAGASSFGLTTPSWGTTRPSGTNGTSVTPGTASEGTFAALGSALTAAAYGILININSAFTSATARNYIVDIGIDLAGGTSFTAQINDLLAGGADSYVAGGAAGDGYWYYFPLFIPSGASIGARARGTNATAIRVGCITYSKPPNPSAMRVGSFVETIGASGLTGTAVTSGTTSEGTWTSLGTTTKRTWWWQLGVQVNASDTAWAANVLHADLAVGTAGTKDIILQDQAIITTVNESASQGGFSSGVEYEVPAGSTIYARLQNSGANDAYGVTAYGLGG